MGRWEPDAAGRLRQAAMELYVENGFEQTTVAEIAHRAGLTARTFFRYFADKREVLFAASSSLEERLVSAVDSAPGPASPMTAVAAALDAAAAVLGQRHDYARQRQSVIVAHADLRERELIKMASLTAAVGAALRRRGVTGEEASLAAEVGIAVLRISFERWVNGPGDADLAHLMRESLDQLKALSSAG